jgi:DNA-binding NarL/FixJ family response regulator
MILNQSAQLRLMGIAADCDSASRIVRSHMDCVDVMLLSCAVIGAAEIEIIRNAQPLSTLVLTGTHDDQSIVAALRAGARGYLTSFAPDQHLIRAIQLVESGSAVFCEVVAQRIGSYLIPFQENPCNSAFPMLTDREAEILRLIAQGLNNRQISCQLVISDKTVRNHITQIFSKLQVPDRATAIIKARNAGVGVKWRPLDGAVR